MTFKYENQQLSGGYNYIIGCDEVGRGSLAGPVVAAAVILPVESYKVHKVIKFKEIRDSKLLSAEKREELSEFIKKHSLWSIGVVSQSLIDKINIHNASLLAMKKAIDGLLCHPALDAGSSFIAIDGKFPIPNINHQQEAIIDGDNKVLSIAAASIIAKVYRDNLMRNLHQDYPVYNFAQHKGYGTEYHRAMISSYGLSPIHRLSFCRNLAV